MLTRFLHARRRRDENGMALAVVLMVTALITTLVLVTAALTIGSLRSSSGHDNFEGAVGAAEAGIDRALSQLQANQTWSAGPAVGRTFTSADDERRWAYTTIMSQVGSGVPYASTGTGQYLAIRPSDRNIIYSLGCEPSCTSTNAKKRLVKVEYLFAPYKPGNAILTGGGLAFSSSVTVDVTAGALGTAANVHTNGAISGSGCSQTINGTVTSSGTYSVCGTVGSTGSGGGQPLQSVPTVKPSFLYTEFSAFYSTNWYDLCPDGTVHAPGATQCTGTQITTVASGGTFRGWSFTAGTGINPPVWSMTSSSWGDGIYYVYQGDANISRNISANAISVIAEAAPTGGGASTCGKIGGDISAQGVSIASAALPGVVFVADGQLSVTSNFQGGTGVFAAGDQIHLETSSNGITGTVIANDTCTASGAIDEVKNAVVKYDRNVEVPLVDIVRTTQWLELQPNAS